MVLASGPEPVLTGRSTPPRPPTTLVAGPVTALLDGTDLRHVRVGGVELVQRVYVAVRDAPWNTIPALVGDWSIEQRADSFRVGFSARHQYQAIDFRWRGVIEGSPDGRIRYELDGVCHGTFEYSKIGFNVHHGLAGSVGRAFRAATAEGELRGVLPELIDPQRIVDGTLSGMFAPYRELAIEVADGLEAVVALDGDLLELQDHRNWIDANYKSYGTPLALGFPFTSADGQRIRQVLTISHRGPTPATAAATEPRIAVGGVVAERLPAIGLGMASHGASLTRSEAERLRPIRPAHLRVEVAMSDEGLDDLARAAGDARALDASLELAVFANDDAGDALDRLAARLGQLGVAVAQVLVYPARDGFSALGGVTPASTVRLVRDRLGPVTGDVPFAGGTNQSFADLNRDRPTDPAIGGLCFAVSPTVHAADDASIIENVDGIREVIRSARAFGGSRPIFISPVTLATRFGPYPAGPAAPGDLPASVDVRQASLLGAVWTLGALAAAAETAADSVTFYETTGWRGVVERDAGSPDERFPSRPGDVFPMAHVLADVAERSASRARRATVSDPLAVVALALDDASGLCLLVGNAGPADTPVLLTGLPDGPAVVRRLDASSADEAARDPQAFRARSAVADVVAGNLRLVLGGYAIARLDVAAAPSPTRGQ